MSSRPPRQPLRTCLGCRTVRPQPELVRLAVDPAGRLVADRRRLMGGRGGYICMGTAPACLHQALRRRGSLARAFRTPLAVIDENDLLRSLEEHSQEETPPSPPSRS